MQKTIIIVIIALLASGTLAGAYYYHESGRKDEVLDDRTREISALNDRLAKLDAQMQKLEGKRQEDRKQLDALKDGNPYIGRLEKDLHERDQEIKDVKAALEQCGSKRDELLAGLKTDPKTDPALKGKSTETDQKDRENKQANIDKRIKALEEKIQQKNDVLEQLRNEVASYQALKEKWDAKIKADQESSQSLKKQFSQTTKQLETERDTLRKRSEEFDSQIAKLQEQIEKERISETQLKSRLSNLQSEKKALTESIEDLKSTYNALIGDLRENLESREASIRECEDRLSISFVNRVVFGSAMAHLSSEGKEILKKAGDILKQYKEGKIRIVGHTDNIPITSGYRRRYPTNWELSVARASAVVRFFQDDIGIIPQRMEIIGRSYFQPIADNSTKEGRAKNRRVEIIVAPTFASAQTIPQ